MMRKPPMMLSSSMTKMLNQKKMLLKMMKTSPSSRRRWEMTRPSSPTSELPTHSASCSETPRPVPSPSPTTEPSTGFQTPQPSTTSSELVPGTPGSTNHTPSSPPPTTVSN